MGDETRTKSAAPALRLIGGTALVCLAAFARPSLAARPEPSSSPAAPARHSTEPTTPAMVSPRIVAPSLPDQPVSGKGRLAMVFSGNRRWCTFPDDRPIKPLEDPRRPVLPGYKNEVYTFGYQFTVAAIRRGAPDRPLMLFESPIVRTAEMMPAVKAGGPPGPHKVAVGPSVGAQPLSDKARLLESGATLVPVWQEKERCTTLPERFDFDLEPGTYDVYAAFDLLGKEGGWGHRTTAYLTDIPVESGRITRLDAVANMPGGTERELSLDKAGLIQSSQAPGGDGR